MNTAEKVIARFGGLTATARALSEHGTGVPVTTVQGWKTRGRIPERYWARLVDAAFCVGISLTGADFIPDDLVPEGRQSEPLEAAE
ncbi:MAG: hypothetical protein CML23_21880 [Rhizobiaceae bacterium]|nr:hypothetical protein [Rhizobiaceae bacterium]